MIIHLQNIKMTFIINIGLMIITTIVIISIIIIIIIIALMIIIIVNHPYHYRCHRQ